MSSPAIATGTLAPRRRSSLQRRQALEAYLCILPWLIGFICFTAGPMLLSLYMSFNDWAIISPPEWIGLGNFQHMSVDRSFWEALYNTAYISFLSVPLQLALCVSRNSSSLRIASRRASSIDLAYVITIPVDECPSSCARVIGEAPAAARREANVWRRS